MIFVIYTHVSNIFGNFMLMLIAHKKFEPPRPPPQQKEKSSPGLQPIIQLPQFIFQGVVFLSARVCKFFSEISHHLKLI